MKKNIRSFDLNLLRVLDVLLDECNVTRAAERLALTQPAVSSMLNRLRDTFDDPLFIRSQRGLIATERALSLSAPVKDVLHQANQLLAPAKFDPTEFEGSITIAATDYAHKVFLSPFFGWIYQQAPNLKVTTTPLQKSVLVDQLAQGQVDIGISRSEWAGPNLYGRGLAQEKFICAMGKRYRRLVPEGLKEFCQLDHLLLSLGGSGGTQLDAVLARKNKQRRIAITMANFLTVPDVLAQRPIVVVGPQRLLDSFRPEVVTFDPPVKLDPMEIKLVWHGRHQTNPMHQWFRESLVSFFN